VDVNVNLKAPYNGTGGYLIGVLDATDVLAETDESNNTVGSTPMQ